MTVRVAAVQFNVLGTFEVIDGGRALELGGYKQRAALAVLLLSANRVVPADKLIDELWGETPPGQATGSLQAYVSNLRRALEPDRAPREQSRVLRSQGGGYLLAVDLADVDSAVFEHQASEGRTLLRQGRAAAARDALARGLGLWRGPALVDFADEPFARTEAARLEELRAVALEDRIAADLALGEHAAVVAEVKQLVDREPLREQLWAHLILALYRSGRQGDALAAYRECRRTLSDELGIDPGPSLRRLEADVLQQSPALDWSAPEQTAASAAQGGAIAYLVYDDAGGRERSYMLDGRSSPITVGRDSPADVWLSWDHRVSRKHAQLECEGDAWLLVDEGISSNGSFVNDERINGRRELRHGDELRFGSTSMTFRLPAESSGAATHLDE